MRGFTSLWVGILVVLLLRSTALSTFAARGVVIDILAFTTAIWALRHGPSWGATFGFAIGLCADIDAGHWLGRHALILTLLGYFLGRLADTLVRDSVRTQFVLLFIAVAAHQAASVAFEVGGLVAWPYLISRTLLAAAFTAPLGTLLLWIARRLRGRSLFGNVPIQPGSTL